MKLQYFNLILFRNKQPRKITQTYFGMESVNSYNQNKLK